MTNLVVYEPREDSTLLEQYVRQYAKGSVLDIGTGSGIQAIAAAKNKKVKQVIATDIQDSVITFNEKIKIFSSTKKFQRNFLCPRKTKGFSQDIKSMKYFLYNKKNVNNNKIKFLKSNLFDNIKNQKFDTIIFNPPYLPQELKLKDLTFEGGKKGYEVIEKFLNGVNNFLKTDGIVLIVFSSLTKKEKVDEFIRNNLLEFEELAKKHIFFEDLYVYKIKKASTLKTLEKKKIKNIKYFAKGKRGIVFTGYYKNKKTAIKIKNPESEAVLRINNEINFLKILNKKNIGPKLLFYDKDFFAYGFVEGINISEFLEKPIINKKAIIDLIKKIMSQMYIMDKLKINKEEMSHPQKHIIINKKNKPVLIDFERAHCTIKPSNATQFCDFLISKHMATILKSNNIKIDDKKIISAAKKYKKQQNKENFNRIINEIK